MKTLINGIYYQITADTEVVYQNGEIITITDDSDGHWGICFNGEFIPLHTFEVDGVQWYFTNDLQEMEIRNFVSEVLPLKSLDVTKLEWIKTVPLNPGPYNDEFAVYCKLKGTDSYHSVSEHASSEEELLRHLTAFFQ